MTQGEQPKYLYYDNAYYLTFYTTSNMRTTFSVGPREEAISFTQFDKAESKSRNSVRYGSYKKVEPLTSHPISIHATVSNPMPLFKSVERTIKVTHWDRIYVDEKYHLINDIAELKGGFSRVDFEPHSKSGATGITQLQSTISEEAENLYYVDPVGNCSTSVAQNWGQGLVFIISPRFPIFGGWKNIWNQGYDLPSSEYIQQNHDDPSQYVFTTPLSQAYDIVARNFSLSIVLPEGATDIKVNVPYDLETSTSSTYSYIDLRGGRPTLTLTGQNIVPKAHPSDVTVLYRLETSDLYFKPLVLVAYAFCIFIALMVYFRAQNKQKQD